MSQAWELPILAGDTVHDAIQNTIAGALESLRTLHSGPIEPAAPVAYMLWMDTTAGVLKQRDSTNTSWADLLGAGGGAPDDAEYFVAAAHAGLSAERVVTAAGAALLDDADAAAQRTTLGLGSAAVEGVAAFDAAGTGAAEVATHVGLADPHTQYQKESEKGVAGGYAALDGSGFVPDAQLPAGIARDSEVAAAVTAHEAAGDPHVGYQKETEKDAPSGYAGLDANSTVALTRGLRETGGPTNLVVGAIVDGEFLKRVGATIVSAVPGGGPGGAPAFTVFTKDLGVSRRDGTFDLSGLSGLTAEKVVFLHQTAGPIASKGNARDEGEMDAITLTGFVVNATTIRAYWRATGVVVGVYEFAVLVSG